MSDTNRESLLRALLINNQDSLDACSRHSFLWVTVKGTGPGASNTSVARCKRCSGILLAKDYEIWNNGFLAGTRSGTIERDGKFIEP